MGVALWYTKVAISWNRKMLGIISALLKAGLGTDRTVQVPADVDWAQLCRFAQRQGVLAIVMDGLQWLTEQGGSAPDAMDEVLKVRCAGMVMRQEQRYNAQWTSAKKLAALYAENGLDTLVMKGFSLSRLYPAPQHRPCTDMDCLLQWHGSVENRCAAGEKGNRLAEEHGLPVDRGYYKNSVIAINGLTVENHRYLLPIKGSGKAKRLERQLRLWIYDGGNGYISDSQLMATSPFFDSVYVLAHAQEHFLNGGIALRHVCDWAMVLKAHADKVDWEEWKKVCSEFGMISFGYAISRMARDICGVAVPFGCPEDNEADRLLLDDIICHKPMVANRTPLQTRVDLVKGMFANRWKYRYFAETSALAFCARRIWGYLFDKDID